MWSGGSKRFTYSLLQYIYLALLLSPSLHNDEWLGRILMVVVDVREEVSVQLFPSYMLRY